MNGKTKHLIIIPGLGDRTWLYMPLTLLWRKFSFSITIYNYGWGRSVSNKVRLKKLTNEIDRYDEVYLIGISAGGTAAINSLFLLPHKIKKVITICTPYTPVPLNNSLLRHSITRLTDILDSKSNIKKKIISICSKRDIKIPAKHTFREDIKQVVLNTPGHWFSILVALLIKVPSLIK